jgi:hypothetical protein
MAQVLKPKAKKRKRPNPWQFTMTMVSTVVMLASGAFGLLPNNPVTQLFQKVISEQFDYPFIEPLNSFLAQFNAPQIPEAQNASEVEITQNPLLDPVGILIGFFTSSPTPGVSDDGSNNLASETETSLVATQVSVILTDVFVAESTRSMSAATPSATSTGTSTPIATPSVTSTPTPTPTSTPTYFYPSPTVTLTSTPTYFYASPTATQTPAYYALTGTPTPSDEAPFVVDTYPANEATGVPGAALIVVTFNEEVNISMAYIQCVGSGATDGGDFWSMTASGSGTSVITYDPGGLPASNSCSVMIPDFQVSDVDLNDPPDTMTASYSFQFTVAP